MLSRDDSCHSCTGDDPEQERPQHFSALGQAEIRQKQPRERQGQENGTNETVLSRDRQQGSGHGWQIYVEEHRMKAFAKATETVPLAGASASRSFCQRPSPDLT